MDEIDILIDKYEERFGEMIPLKMIHMTDDTLKKTLLNCLQTNTPYKIPENIRLLMEADVEFQQLGVKSMNENKPTTTVIEFEFKNAAPYNMIRELIQKICEDHEGKRDLRIKITYN